MVCCWMWTYASKFNRIGTAFGALSALHGLLHGKHRIDAQQSLRSLVFTCRPKLLYIIPVHNNPRGTILPLQRRAKLVRLSQQYGFTIIADEVYQLLTFPSSTPAPAPLRAVHDDAAVNAEGDAPSASSGAGNTVVSLGSFSKIMAPGLRLG